MTETPTPEVDEDVLEHLYEVFFGDLGLCGCGSPDEGWKLIHAILTECGKPQWTVESRNALIDSIGPPGVVHLVMSLLDDVLLEHGTSYWSSWLTDKGKWTLWAINTVGLDNLEVKLDEVGYPHDGGDCSAECYRIPAVEAP